MVIQKSAERLFMHMEMGKRNDVGAGSSAFFHPSHGLWLWKVGVQDVVFHVSSQQEFMTLWSPNLKRQKYGALHRLCYVQKLWYTHCTLPAQHQTADR